MDGSWNLMEEAVEEQMWTTRCEAERDERWDRLRNVLVAKQCVRTMSQRVVTTILTDPIHGERTRRCVVRRRTVHSPGDREGSRVMVTTRSRTSGSSVAVAPAASTRGKEAASNMRARTVAPVRRKVVVKTGEEDAEAGEKKGPSRSLRAPRASIQLRARETAEPSESAKTVAMLMQKKAIQPTVEKPSSEADGEKEAVDDDPEEFVTQRITRARTNRCVRKREVPSPAASIQPTPKKTRQQNQPSIKKAMTRIPVRRKAAEKSEDGEVAKKKAPSRSVKRASIRLRARETAEPIEMAPTDTLTSVPRRVVKKPSSEAEAGDKERKEAVHIAPKESAARRKRGRPPMNATGSSSVKTPSASIQLRAKETTEAEPSKKAKTVMPVRKGVVQKTEEDKEESVEKKAASCKASTMKIRETKPKSVAKKCVTFEVVEKPSTEAEGEQVKEDVDVEIKKPDPQQQKTVRSKSVTVRKKRTEQKAKTVGHSSSSKAEKEPMDDSSSESEFETIEIDADLREKFRQEKLKRTATPRRMPFFGDTRYPVPKKPEGVSDKADSLSVVDLKTAEVHCIDDDTEPEFEEEDEEVDLEKEKQFLQVQFMDVLGECATPTTWLKLTEQKMRFEFNVKGQDKIWNIPVAAITEILFAKQEPQAFWVAFRLSGGIPYPDNPYQIVITSNGPRPKWRRYVFDNFLHTAGLVEKFKRVCVFDLIDAIGKERGHPILFRTAQRQEHDEKKLLHRRPKPTPEDRSPVVPELQTTLHLSLAEGKKWTIGIPQFLRCLRPNGWMSTDMVDIVLDHFIKDRLSDIPFWSEGGATINVFDSVFFQRLLKYETLLTGNFDRNNYMEVLDEIYPKRGRHRSTPDIDKDVLVVPVILQKHWFLVVIHKPQHAFLDTEYLLDYYENALDTFVPDRWQLPVPLRTCRVLIFDSLFGNVDQTQSLQECHQRSFKLIKGWLKLLIWARDELFDNNFRLMQIEQIPTQPNSNDCGIYMLLFLQKLIMENWGWMEIPDKELKVKLDLRSDTFLDEASAYRPMLYQMLRSLATDWPLFLSDDMEDERKKLEAKQRERELTRRAQRDQHEVQRVVAWMVDHLCASEEEIDLSSDEDIPFSLY